MPKKLDPDSATYSVFLYVTGYLLEYILKYKMRKTGSNLC